MASYKRKMTAWQKFVFFVLFLIILRLLGAVNANILYYYGELTCGKYTSMSDFDTFSYEFYVNNKRYTGKAHFNGNIDYDSLQRRTFLIHYNSKWPKNHSILTSAKLDSCGQIYDYIGLVRLDSSRVKPSW